MKGKDIGCLIVILLWIVILLGSCATTFSSDSSSSSHRTNTCSVCGRTYESGDSGGNFRCISRTNMCKNCYKNYKYATDALGK